MPPISSFLKYIYTTPLLLTLFSFMDISNGKPGSIHHVPYEEDDFDWNEIKPSPILVYHKCFNGLECARLEVPLDWSNTSNPNKVILAISRLRSKVKPSDAAFGGTIVLNPGGPGGSGIDLLREHGRGMQAIVDSEKQFEMLSFDPRGVKFTTPSTACFGDDLSRQVYNLKSAAVGTIDLSDEAFNTQWAATAGFAALCEHSPMGVYPDGSNIRQFVSTALVARDMVALIDSVDEHLQRTLERKNQRPTQIPLRSNIKTSQPLLNYWGYSYGTYLGNTFASLFPSRIGRMLLDGVVDAPDYAASGWTSNLQDTHKVMTSIITDCFAGGKLCPLYEEGMTSAADIGAKITAFMAELADNPIPVVHNGTVELITLMQVRGEIFDSLYRPMDFYPFLGQMLADLMSGNATLIIPNLPKLRLHSSNSSSTITTPSSSLHPFLAGVRLTASHSGAENTTIPPPVKPLSPSYVHRSEATTAILCGDGTPITSHSKSNFKSYLSLLKSQSPLAAGLWARIKLPCVHYAPALRPSAANSFIGPFTSNLSSYSPGASPLLFLGNTADPVTPVRNAWKMSDGHEGSGVLVLDAPGHCSGVDKPSGCVDAALRAFFARGQLPKKGKVCGVDRRAWDGKGNLVGR